MSSPVCVVLGAGPGNGASISARFAKAGYRVAVCARNQERVSSIASEIEGARAYSYDARDPAAAEPLFARIRDELGPVATLVFNAGSGQFGSIDDTDVDAFQAAWEVNTRGLFLAAKAVLPDMRAAGAGSIAVIGATASLKAGPAFAAFASAKSAQRSLAQSMAKHLGPEKIHVSYVVVDGIINLERVRAASDRPDEFFMEPDQIAEAVYYLATQPSQAWTFELDLRPYGEKW